MSRLEQLLRSRPATADFLAYSFLGIVTLLRFALLWGTPMDLAPDEAHYWEWSRQLDWAYYSKGPVVAVLIAASTRLLGDTELAVRLPAFVCQLLFFVLLYRGLRRLTSANIALLVLLLANAMIVFSYMGFVMTTDAPTALCWLLALLCAANAVRDDRPWWWTPCFLFVGITVLAKYTAALLAVSLMAFLVSSPKTRPHLRSVGFWTGQVLFGLCLLPILWWNSQHSWVNLAHNASHLGRERTFEFTLQYLVELIGGQIGLLGPLVFWGLCTLLAFTARRWKHLTELDRLYLFASLPLLLLCLGVSFTRRVYANWPMPAYIGLLFLFASFVHRAWLPQTGKLRWTLPAIVLSAVMTVAAYLTFAGYTFGLPGTMLPTKRLVGWEEAAAKARQMLVEKVPSEDWFIVAEDYETASALAFYIRPHPRVFVAPLGDRRMNQYDLWGGWSALQGKTVLLALKSPAVVSELRPYFASSSRRYRSFWYPFAGARLRTLTFYWATDYNGQALPELRKH